MNTTYRHSLALVVPTLGLLAQVALAEGAAEVPSSLLMAQNEAPAPAEGGGDGESDIAALVEAGEPVYQELCSSCHAESGRGDIGPSLQGNGKLADGAAVHRQISQGGDEMPGFGTVLSEEEIRAVSTFVMNSWGNAYGAIPAAAE